MRLSLVFFVLLIFFFPLEGLMADGQRNRNFREEMRQFVRGLSDYARQKHPGFLIIPQNGQELITVDGKPESPVSTEYLNAIDGTGREDLFYGYKRDNKKTALRDLEYLRALCQKFRSEDKVVLVTDYCRTPDKIDDSYNLNQKEGFISFAAPERDLTLIPRYPDPIFNGNDRDMKELAQVKNFLYLINGDRYPHKASLIEALSQTDYDLIILDLFQYDEIFKKKDLILLKRKSQGGQRLVICYMSIGEAEDYRYYWQKDWEKNPPSWLEEENPRWEGNFKVRYWDPAWQSLIYGERQSYLDRIIDAGFDGVYLDIIDGFEYFE